MNKPAKTTTSKNEHQIEKEGYTDKIIMKKKDETKGYDKNK